MSLKILSGKFKGRILHSPKGSPTRPTLGIVRAAVFNICRPSIKGARFLDLFAGSGAMGLEALSQGAGSAVFIEQNRLAARCIAENLDLLQLQQQGRVLAMNHFRAVPLLAKENVKFDLIYIDPPYDQGAKIPDVLQMLVAHTLCAPGALIFAEDSSEQSEFTMRLPELKQIDARAFGIARVHQFVYVGKL